MEMMSEVEVNEVKLTEVEGDCMRLKLSEVER